MSLFEIPEAPDTWRNHAWWTCTDTACKWCGRPKARESAAMRSSFGWDSEALTWIESLESGYIFTADTLAEHVGDAPNTGVSGAVFRQAQARGLISSCGYETAKKKTSHGRVLRLWIKN